MRSIFILAYDISDEKRLRKVYNYMMGYGKPLQYSVFMLELSEKEKAIMVVGLLGLIDQSEDSILIISLGRKLRTRIQFIGIRKSIPKREAVII